MYWGNATVENEIFDAKPCIPHSYWAPTLTGAGSPFKVEFSEDSSGVQRGGGLYFGTSPLSL
jgi:hypothetical protein